MAGVLAWRMSCSLSRVSRGASGTAVGRECFRVAVCTFCFWRLEARGTPVGVSPIHTHNHTQKLWRQPQRGRNWHLCLHFHLQNLPVSGIC